MLLVAGHVLVPVPGQVAEEGILPTADLQQGGTQLREDDQLLQRPSVQRHLLKG